MIDPTDFAQGKMHECDNRALSHRERGRLGGRATLAKLGREHFAEIGRVGGETVVARYGPEHMARIGRAGGETYDRKYVVTAGHPWSPEEEGEGELPF